MTEGLQEVSETKMIERILNTQEAILEKQSDMGEQLAKMQGLWTESMRSMISEHEKECEKKGVSIFRLKAPVVFNIAAVIGLVYLVININSAFNSQIVSTSNNTSDIKFLKHTVDSIKTEVGKD